MLRCIMLVGNKTDLGGTVSEARHVQAANNPSVDGCSKLMHARTSAKTGEGVEDAFTNLIKQIYEHDKKHSKDALQAGGMTLNDAGMGKKKGGCC